MIVCQCKGVSDRTIRGLAREGRATVYEVARSCSAGTDCGTCRETILQILLEEGLRSATDRNPTETLLTFPLGQ